MVKVKVRNSNFELLRNVAIFMIIGLHYLNGSMGGALGNVVKGSFNYYIAYFIESSFIIGVNLFVIITSYFSIDKVRPKLSKILRLIITAYFYGAVFYIISVVVGLNTFNIKDFIKQINPFLIGNYWFIIMYIILYLVSPYLNIVLNNIGENMHKGLIIVMGVFFCVWPSFLPCAPSNDGGYGIISFILLYCITAYIKKYYNKNKSIKSYLMIYILSALITFVFSIVEGTWNPWGYNFIFNIIGAVALFLAFSKLNIKSKIINYIARYTFPIYLIHFNPIMIAVVFKGLLKCQNFYSSKFFILHMFISIIVIYTISFIIESIRRGCMNLVKLILPKSILKDFNNLENKIDNLVYEKIYGQELKI